MLQTKSNIEMPSLDQLKEYLNLVVISALDAGAAILKIYGTEFSIEEKEDKSPLTAADKEAHSIITKMLEVIGIPILSEEGSVIPYDERKQWDLFWCVDPLDGTKEFIKRNGEFTVNIALIHLGAPILGVIYVPVDNELYFSVKGIGAFKVEKATAGIESEMLKSNDGFDHLTKNASILPLESSRSTFTVVASRSHLSPETEEYIQDLQNKHGEVEIMSCGSSLKICMVAEGKADVYPRFGPTMEWDTAAGQALVEAAGGQLVVHPYNTPLRYNKEDLLNPYFIVFK